MHIIVGAYAIDDELTSHNLKEGEVDRKHLIL
jgi:hypothetical protein